MIEHRAVGKAVFAHPAQFALPDAQQIAAADADIQKTHAMVIDALRNRQVLRNNAGAECDHAVAAVVLNDIRAVAAIEQVAIGPAPACQRIRAGAAGQHVLARAARQAVVARLAVQHIAAARARQVIVRIRAVKGLAGVAAGQDDSIAAPQDVGQAERGSVGEFERAHRAQGAVPNAEAVTLRAVADLQRIAQAGHAGDGDIETLHRDPGAEADAVGALHVVDSVRPVAQVHDIGVVAGAALE